MRPLRYPLKNVLTNESVGGDMESPSSTTLQWATDDPDERVTITLDLSLNEYVALASALDAGRDIAYGLESLEIWKIWVRSVNALSFCQQIADCINDPNSPANEAIKNLINDGGRSNPDSPIFTGNDSGLGGEQDRTLAKDVCDLDLIFGFCDQLVTLLNDTIVDMFELVEVASNSVERIAIWTDNVPFLSETIDLAEQLAEETLENYNAYYTDAIHNKFACDLFCMMKDAENCVLMFSEMANYFYGRAGFTPTNIGINVALETLSEGLIGGGSTVYALHGMLCATLQYGSNFLGLDVGGLQRIVQSYLNDPNEDWLTLCDDCPVCVGEIPVNFVETSDCWESPSGEWLDTQGFVSQFNGDGTSTVSIYRNFEPFLHSSAFTIKWGNFSGNQGFFPNFVVYYEDETNSGNLTDYPAGLDPEGITDTVSSANPYPAKNIVRIEIQMTGGASNESEFVIKQVS